MMALLEIMYNTFHLLLVGIIDIYNSFKNLYSISTGGDNVSVKSQIDSRILASNNIDKR